MIMIMSVCSYPSICGFFTGGEKYSLFAEACKFLLAVDAFKIPSLVAETGTSECKGFIGMGGKKAMIFKKKVTLSLQGCIDKASSKSGKFHSDKIWTAYHSLRTSDVYVCDWECVMLKTGVSEPSAISYQYIGDYILKT